MELKAKKQEDGALPFPQSIAERTLCGIEPFRSNIPADNPGLFIAISFYSPKTLRRVVDDRPCGDRNHFSLTVSAGSRRADPALYRAFSEEYPGG
ncbi:MAG: hypothetical protein JWR09_4825 [Mucilaginibacter sp.]|nr:hypothetical protein [Mucilaginibacter sp.]